jgi:hypothetical protein
MPNPGTPPERRSRRGLYALLIASVAIIVLAAVGVIVTKTLNKSSPTAFVVGSCVKRDGTHAKAANCADADAFTIIKKVDAKSDCPDPTQPYIEVRQAGGKTEFLCLRPAATK